MGLRFLVHLGLMIIFTNFDQIYRKLCHQNVDRESAQIDNKKNCFKKGRIWSILTSLGQCTIFRPEGFIFLHVVGLNTVYLITLHYKRPDGVVDSIT